MSGYTSPSTTNLLSTAGQNSDFIAPDVEDGDLEAQRNVKQGRANSSVSQGGHQLAPQSSGNSAGQAQGAMNAPQREQSIWEQSA